MFKFPPEKERERERESATYIYIIFSYHLPKVKQE